MIYHNCLQPDEDLQYIGRKFVIKIFALKNFKINIHQNVSRAFNILHYNYNGVPIYKVLSRVRNSSCKSRSSSSRNIKKL